MKMRYIPNILSMLRIPFSIALLFLVNRQVLFIISYAIAGVADVLDGFLARRFQWETKLGAKMDSIGDVIFLVCAVVAVLWGLEKVYFAPYIYITVGVIALIRAVNALITRVKFKQWGFIHNLFVKYSSVPIFFLIPYSIWKNEVPNLLLLSMLCLIVLASFEETWILKNMEEYDMNMKSIWHMKKHKRNQALVVDAAETDPRRKEEVAL